MGSYNATTPHSAHPFWLKAQAPGGGDNLLTGSPAGRAALAVVVVRVLEVMVMVVVVMVVVVWRWWGAWTTTWTTPTTTTTTTTTATTRPLRPLRDDDVDGVVSTSVGKGWVVRCWWEGGGGREGWSGGRWAVGVVRW